MPSARQPWDFDDARSAAAKSTRMQAQAEEFYRDASRNLAQATRVYRIALAQKITELHANEGVAWSACDLVARGDVSVAKLRYDRDIAAGVLKAAEHALWRATADRRDTGRFTDWSMRVALEGRGEPAWTPEAVA